MDMIDNSVAYTFYANITLFCNTILRLHVVEFMAQMIHSGLRSYSLRIQVLSCSFLYLTVDEGQKYFHLSFLLLFW